MIIGKRLAAMLMIVALMVAIPVGQYPAAAEKPIYLALGDSITTGYGLEGYTKSPSPYAVDSFVTLLAQKEGLQAMNLAVDGRASGGLSKSITTPSETLQKALPEAELITITVGGNDLLNAFYKKLAEKLNVDMSQSGAKSTIIKKIAVGVITKDKGLMQLVSQAAQEFSTQMNEVTATFEKNLNRSLRSIRKSNPHCYVVVATVPNPYSGMAFTPELDTAFSEAVQGINAVILRNSEKEGYGVADIYTEFLKEGSALTNADNPASPLNPHPNKEGHSKIAVQMEQAYQQLKNPPITNWRNQLYAIYETVK